MDVLIMDMGPNVKGESSIRGYEGKIELLSFSQSVATQHIGDLSAGERTSGRDRGNRQNMTVTKYLDSASPTLHQASIEGKQFPEVKIIIGRKDGGEVSELIRYNMKGVLISSISVGGGDGGKPVETLMLDYNQITWDYTPHRPGADESE